jgi:hypothetical protein
MIRPKQIPTSSFQTDLSDSEQSREIPETPYSRQPDHYSLPSFILFLPPLPLFWQIEVRPVALPARNHAENRLCVSAGFISVLTHESAKAVNSVVFEEM